MKMVQVKSLTKTQSAALRFLRVLALFLIAVCHLMEAYGNPWSATFYTGVPLFFLISGFLYGKKDIRDWKKWALSRFKKIYVPYFCFVVPALFCFALVKPQFISYRMVLYVFNLQGVTGSMMGLNHLWFMTAIMVCYLFVPLLQRLRPWSNMMLLFLLLMFVACFICLHGRFYWLPLYMIAYFTASASVSWNRIVSVGIFIITIFQLATWRQTLLFPLDVQYFWGRSLLAFCLMQGAFSVFSRCGLVAVGRIVNWLDSISYPFFLVHNVWMVGPFGMAYTTPWPILDMFAMLVLSFISACLLKKGAENVAEKICIRT